MIRALQEARAVNQIGHPNIVDVFSFGKLADGRSYFVMEWLPGRTLADRLARGPIPLDEQLDILEQVADALEAAHRSGIIHRDLKPDNVFLTEVAGTRRVKLLDFGIAKLGGGLASQLESAGTGSGVMMGTPFYFAPEQARGRGVDARADIYSLGVVAFELATGELPFDADNVADVVSMHLHQPPRAPSSLSPELPAALDRLILQTLEKDPSRRPTWLAIRATLRELRRAGPARAISSAPRATEPAGVPGPPPVAQALPPAWADATQRVGPSGRRRHVLAVGAGMLAVALLVLGFLRHQVPSRPRAVAPSPTLTPVAHPPPPLPPPSLPPPSLPPAPASPAAMGTIALRGPLADANVQMDGRPAPTHWQAGVRTLEAVPGLHRVVVSAPGHRVWHQQVAVEAGKTVELAVVLARAVGVPKRAQAKPALTPAAATPSAPSPAPTPTVQPVRTAPPQKKGTRDSLIDPLARPP